MGHSAGMSTSILGLGIAFGQGHHWEGLGVFPNGAWILVLLSANLGVPVHKNAVPCVTWAHRMTLVCVNRHGLIKTLFLQDYGWQEHCFSFINRLLPEMGALLDQKFDCTYNLTYNT